MNKVKAVVLGIIAVVIVIFLTLFILSELCDLIPIPIGINTGGGLWIAAVAILFAFYTIRKIAEKNILLPKSAGVMAIAFIVAITLGFVSFFALQSRIPSKHDQMECYGESSKVVSETDALNILLPELKNHYEHFPALKFNLRFKNGYPKWVIWTRYKMKFHQYVIDARTGEISGL